MRTDRSSTSVHGYLSESHDDERLALRRIVGTTLAALAEMDRLLDRANRLLAHRLERDKSAPAIDEPTFISQAAQAPAFIPCVRPRMGQHVRIP